MMREQADPIDKLKHVLIISQIFPPDLGGSATRALNLAKGLTRLGVKVTVIAGVPHYPLGRIPPEYRWKPFAVDRSNPFEVVRTFMFPLASVGLWRRLILFATFMISSIFPIFRVRKPDLVFASHPQVLSLFPSFVYGKLHSCPVILNVDDLWPEELYDLKMISSPFMAGLSERVAGTAYRIADLICPISPAYVEVITGKYGIHPDKVHVVPGGVDLTLFPPRHLQSDAGEAFRVVYIGALSPAYDFHQVIQAAKLLESEPGLTIRIQGAGEMVTSIAEEIRRENASGVSLVEGVVPREEAAKIMMEADALLLPLSGFENIQRGISAKIYEYQAAEKPIICCSNGMPGKYVTDTRSGIVVPPGDASKLADAMRELRRHRALGDELGKNGRRHVVENLSVEAISRQLIQIWLDMNRRSTGRFRREGS
jgi:glycosyltransferase involved in cell wall biosynthesis